MFFIVLGTVCAVDISNASNTEDSNLTTDNVNAFFTNNSKEEYAAKILEVMNNEKLYNKVSKNAYKDLYKNWDDVVKEAYELYEKMINKNKGN